MGSSNSIPQKYKTMEKNYQDGITKKRNFNIDNIYLTLLMKLSFCQIHCKLRHLPKINETVAYSNKVTKQVFTLPPTIDFISGMNITNKSADPIRVVLMWDGSASRRGRIIVETFNVEGNRTHNFCFNNLYLYKSIVGKWVVKTDPNVSIEYRCGIVDTKEKRHKSNNYKNINGHMFSFNDGWLSIL
jgi:hypothetical protein